MMTPIYFPFTYLPQPVFEALNPIFGRLAVYQPLAGKVPETMTAWVESGRLDIRAPIEDNGEDLLILLREYRAWADLHPASQRVFSKFQGNAIPFSSDTQISNIRAEIKRRIQAKEKRIKSDPLFEARLFLLLAQDFNIQQTQLQNEFHWVEKMEQQLMDDVKGEDRLDPAIAANIKTSEWQDPLSFMTFERLNAWSWLMQQDPETSALYLTGSRAAFQDLLERVPSAENVSVFDAVSIPCSPGEIEKDWIDGFTRYLETLADGSTNPEDRFHFPNSKHTGTVRFTLNVVPDTSPRELFSRFTEQQPARFRIKQRFKNTLLGLVER